MKGFLMASLVILALFLAGCAANNVHFVGTMGNLECYEWEDVGAMVSLGYYGCQDNEGKMRTSVSGAGPGVVNGLVAPTVQAGGTIGAGAMSPPGGGH